jgi:cytochrome c oxidase subunit 1
MLGEGLGKAHFWFTAVGMNLTFFPMHFSGLMGMPRRIYRYDAGQGWEGFNFASSIGAYILGFGMLLFVWNIIRSRSSGRLAGNDPWGAPTLEWMIPSPPPEYNFARIPIVTSRYPLWDMKRPELTTDVPHSQQGDREMGVAIAGQDAGTTHPQTAAQSYRPAESGAHIETETYTLAQLGIALPDPTIKPLITALGLAIMLTAPLFMHHAQLMEAAGNMPAAKMGMTMFWVVVLSGATLMVGMLYNWLLTPLESEHHHPAA